jgi:hypothetical protein
LSGKDRTKEAAWGEVEATAWGAARAAAAAARAVEAEAAWAAWGAAWAAWGAAEAAAEVNTSMSITQCAEWAVSEKLITELYPEVD